MNPIKYTEIFTSLQGEGFYTGRSTAWLRFFLCNLQCDGFGQKNPTDPSTYVLPYKTYDLLNITKVEELPVWEYGCDSSYTWAKKYSHLAQSHTAIEICDLIQQKLQNKTNPKGLFRHPRSNQMIHMAFTGGEPMLNQDSMLDIIQEFIRRDNKPYNVTVETNGTKPFKKNSKFDKFIFDNYRDTESEWFWSVSPKLYSTSGEKPEKAICPEVVGSYFDFSMSGQLKYVVNGTQRSWDEVDEYTEKFRDAGVSWDVYIMPVGATKQEQEQPQIAEIANEALKRGYHVSGRLHCYMFGNKIGT